MSGKRNAFTDRQASRRERSEVIANNQRTAPQNKINIFLLTAHGRFLFLKKKMGVRSGARMCAFRATEGRPYGEETKKICSRPMVLGRERLFASWCHPNSRQTVSFGLLLRGGSRGRFRPRSAAVLRSGRSERFQRCVPLCGSGFGVLLRHHSGIFSQ